MFVILNWYQEDSIWVVCDPSTLKTIIFSSEGEARTYADYNLTGSWRVVDLF